MQAATRGPEQTVRERSKAGAGSAISVRLSFLTITVVRTSCCSSAWRWPGFAQLLAGSVHRVATLSANSSAKTALCGSVGFLHPEEIYLDSHCAFQVSAYRKCNEFRNDAFREEFGTRRCRCLSGSD